MQAIASGYGAYLPEPPLTPRSVSLSPPQDVPTRASIYKAKSTNTLRTAAMVEAEQANSFKTLKDPRSGSTSDLSRRGSSQSQKTGVDMEVEALSNKLISAINHQQELDDSLTQTRTELDAAQRHIADLEARIRQQDEQVASGVLVKKVSVDRIHDKITSELADAKREASQAVTEKRGMEAELENLTASLFEEANKMVATAKKDLDVVEKKNQQLRDQIKDEEAIIASQSEQLTELKSLMQHIQNDHRKEFLDSPRVSLGVAESPKVEPDESNLARLLGAMDLEPLSADQPISPSPSTRFTHLLRAECRTDVPAFEDFQNLIQTSSVRSHNPSHAPSRAGSGSYGGLNVIGLSSMYNNATGNASSTIVSSTANSKVSAASQPPGAFSPTPDSKGPAPLKDTRFFKRVMLEDVEPTLRLDLSPSISWLSRRSILAAFADSTLGVEPIPEASAKLYGRYTPCSLCGESRKTNENPRTHAMKIREGEGATKWSICVLCLEKVRAVGDLVSYIRMVRDGVVRCGDQKEEEDVWEELVRLRERLFWARMAGGVVPSFIPSLKNSPHPDLAQPKPVSESPGFVTPAQTPQATEEDGPSGHEEPDEISKQAEAQLQAGLDSAADLTTFANAKQQAMKRASLQSNPATGTPPGTPPRKRESGAFSRISIPRIPSTFWESQVNTIN